MEELEGSIWLSSKIRGPILGVLIIRIIVYMGLFWGPLFMEIPMQSLKPYLAKIRGTATAIGSTWARVPSSFKGDYIGIL